MELRRAVLAFGGARTLRDIVSGEDSLKEVVFEVCLTVDGTWSQQVRCGLLDVAPTTGNIGLVSRLEGVLESLGGG
jgi:hypothetical protein